MNHEKKDEPPEMIEILENAIVIYINGNRELFDAIHIIHRKVIIGRILRLDKTEKCKYISCCELFVGIGCIPKNNIKSIEGGTKRWVLNKVN